MKWLVESHAHGIISYFDIQCKRLLSCGDYSAKAQRCTFSEGHCPTHNALARYELSSIKSGVPNSDLESRVRRHIQTRNGQVCHGGTALSKSTSFRWSQKRPWHRPGETFARTVAAPSNRRAEAGCNGVQKFALSASSTTSRNHLDTTPGGLPCRRSCGKEPSGEFACRIVGLATPDRHVLMLFDVHVLSIRLLLALVAIKVS